METIFAKINPQFPRENTDVFAKAAEIINSGGLVAFPTETVYGLGADGLNAEAVKKIYEAKGRPSDNPLILHISDISQLDALVLDVPQNAKKLADAFWPGPLTMIFKKSSAVPAQTSGGLDTVAVRFPENKAAQLLIEKCGVPIAAPSANTSGKPSPTRASHVQYDMDGRIDMIIDGGSCEFGLESTIVDVSSDVPCLLRPGSVTLEMLRDVLGTINVDKAVVSKLSDGEKPKAPGMKYTHYSPSADVVIVSGSADKAAEKINELLKKAKSDGFVTGVIATDETKDRYKDTRVLDIGSRKHPEQIAANLFKMLRKCDYYGIQKVYAEGFSEDEIGLAIMNRLKKAAGYEVVDVGL